MKQSRFAFTTISASALAATLALAAPSASWAQIVSPSLTIGVKPATVNSAGSDCNVVFTVDGPQISLTGDYAPTVSTVEQSTGTTEFTLDGTTLTWSGSGTTSGFEGESWWDWPTLNRMFVQDVNVIIDGELSGTFTSGPATDNPYSVTPMESPTEAEAYASEWSGSIDGLTGGTHVVRIEQSVAIGVANNEDSSRADRGMWFTGNPEGWEHKPYELEEWEQYAPGYPIGVTPVEFEVTVSQDCISDEEPPTEPNEPDPKDPEEPETSDPEEPTEESPQTPKAEDDAAQADKVDANSTEPLANTGSDGRGLLLGGAALTLLGGAFILTRTTRRTRQ